MKDKRISCRIISLNYNGRDLLERFLPSLVKSASASRFPCGVTVLDNGSTDGSVEYVKKHFPEVSVMIAPENKVLCSYNDAVRRMDEDVVILINNDMGTEEGFVDPLLEVFLEKPDAFFVATYGDCSIAKNRWGGIGADITYPGVELIREQPGYAFSAGVGAFDRKKFIEIGGYDEIFLTALYEDVDICYRGWKMGWKGYYAPGSKKSHIGSASMSKRHTPTELKSLAFRNSILFMVKNITDPVLFSEFIFLLMLRLAGAVLLGRWFFIQGFMDALQRLPKTLESRKRVIKKVSYSDRELFRMINQLVTKDRGQKMHIRLMKRCINLLGSTPFLRAPVSIFAFFTLRFFFPLEFFLLRELAGCGSVLDLGCGNHSMVPSFVPDSTETVGVEYFRPYYEEAVREGRHKKYIHANIAEVEFEDKSFDAVVLSDVLEHLTKEEGEELLLRMERWARKKVIVFTPNGFVPQEEYDENPLMEHKSGWFVDEFKKRGYRVFGVRGFKCFSELYLHDGDQKPRWLVHLTNLTQIVTYHVPSLAFQLLCRKEMDRRS